MPHASTAHPLRDVAAHTDRLVWSLADGVAARQSSEPAAAGMSRATFHTLRNLAVFRDELTEAVIRRRYLYRPTEVVDEFLGGLESGGLLARVDGRLVPTDLLGPVFDAIARVVAGAAQELWGSHRSVVDEASALARSVMDAGEKRDGLLQIAQRVSEATDPFHLLWERLANLRLIRNEAHVDAWRSAGLTPGDVEALTDAWSGTETQAPVAYSDALAARGYVADGAVTAAGLAAREGIEAQTDAGVAGAYAAIDLAHFTEILSGLPPTD